jgi:hypothetical protein
MQHRKLELLRNIEIEKRVIILQAGNVLTEGIVVADLFFFFPAHEKIPDLSFHFAYHLVAGRGWRSRKLVSRMKLVRPILRNAIASRDLNKLEAALEKAADVYFEMREIREAKKTRDIILEERRILQALQGLDGKDPDQYFDQLQELVSQADAINFRNPIVDRTKRTLVEIKERKEILGEHYCSSAPSLCVGTHTEHCSCYHWASWDKNGNGKFRQIYSGVLPCECEKVPGTRKPSRDSQRQGRLGSAGGGDQACC